jgi:hypothetical protein
MKLFGEYLVDKNLISEKQLLDALILQIEEQPSVVKIVRDLGLLNQEQILQVLKKQTIDRISFIEAAKTFSLLNEESILKIFNDLASKRTPLGEMLIRTNSLDLTTLTRALDDFFGDDTRDKEKVGNKFSEVFNFITESLFEDIQKLILATANNQISDKMSISMLSDEIHKIIGVARLFELVGLAVFLEKVEWGMRELAARNLNKIDVAILKRVQMILEKNLQILILAKNLYKSQKINSNFLNEKDFAPLVEVVIDQTELLVFDLGFIQKESA